MTDKPTTDHGGRAFPIAEALGDDGALVCTNQGMTKREVYAGQMASAMLSNTIFDRTAYDDIAASALQQADALIAALKE